MLKKLLAFIFTFTGLNIFLTSNPQAIYDPLEVANNKFGIHINSGSDLEDAARLVNTNGGDYGYITVVIREDERNNQTWQDFFNKARRLHLVPIVRIASKMNGGGWQKPSVDEIPGWVSFLGSLNWVTTNRYVIVGNEPNHATEWGGTVNPEEYAEYLKIFSEKLKAENPDFFVLPAGLDASAPSDRLHMSEDTFIRRMVTHNKNIFNIIDGWTSHSYPNPGFSGSETATGRGTLHTYEWEMSLLKSLGVSKKLPIFITETGWAHNMDGENAKYLSTEEISTKMKNAFENNFSNPQIAAITPFIISYSNAPFDIFSWKKSDGSFYDFYYKIAELPKLSGKPKQTKSAKMITMMHPSLYTENEERNYLVYIENTGQNIWKGYQQIEVLLDNKFVNIKPITIIADVEPGGKTLALLKSGS